MTEPLVSICIPTYNGESFLKECLDSCVSQTFDDYEIIICDDGSQDATIKITEQYAKSNNKIRFFKNEKNLGLVANWNKCIEYAKGKWIKFVFQDDYITQNCLQKFVDSIEPSVHLLVSARNFILPENPPANFVNYYTNEVRTLENTNQNKSNLFSAQLISKIAVQNICLNFIGEPSLTFFKKELVKEVGFFNDDLKQICDLEFTLRVASKHGLKYVPEKICAFRIHNNSTTSTNVENKYFELHYIEPLMFSWFLNFSPSFIVFRSHLNAFEKLKLKLYFKTKAYQAQRVNLIDKRDYFLFRSDTTKFKEIYQSKNGNIIVWLFSLLRR